MFGCICAGRPVQTNLTTISPTQFAFTLTPPLNHLVVFLLPDTVLPAGTAATVYIQLPGKPFQLLGAIANEKPSAIFRVKGLDEATLAAAGVIGTLQVPLGISVEPVENVQQQLATLQNGTQQQQQQQQEGMSTALVRVGGGGEQRVETERLAKRIIENCYNFLTGFVQNVGGEEVVAMKHFMEWWRKFERRVGQDDGFLLRDAE
ncbi:DUF775-domain-containing protein [Ascobolus immersus RN42]|uniref:DUF775-domain-containing protein n=1 Tax=Ascobolus immersus RN42 TaxID=1160509 RepID=A0A3N4HGJ5_ASCIM|nr:DUF775-domain-containing protein [Ascobolus immersus RN42]